MERVGFHASHELFPPSELLAAVRAAEQAGFRHAMCSDHFFPWTTRQGHSGYAWSWLGAALEATRLSFGTVCAPGQRYHPAIIAQAGATLAQMYPQRFWFAVGTGQFLNEHITGEPWPTKPERKERLIEAVAAMRRLWRGESVTTHGPVRIEQARLYSRPFEPPLVFGAAITEETAEWVGAWADGLITVASPPEELRRRIAAFRRGGGGSKPVHVQAAISHAGTHEEARRQAFELWGVATLTLEQNQNVAFPEAFDDLVASHDPAEVDDKLRVSPDYDQHRAWIEADLECGVDRVYLHFLTVDLPGTIARFSEHVLSKLSVH